MKVEGNTSLHNCYALSVPHDGSMDEDERAELLELMGKALAGFDTLDEQKASHIAQFAGHLIPTLESQDIDLAHLGIVLMTMADMIEPPAIDIAYA